MKQKKRKNSPKNAGNCQGRNKEVVQYYRVASSSQCNIEHCAPELIKKSMAHEIDALHGGYSRIGWNLSPTRKRRDNFSSSSPIGKNPHLSHPYISSGASYRRFGILLFILRNGFRSFAAIARGPPATLQETIHLRYSDNKTTYDSP